MSANLPGKKTIKAGLGKHVTVDLIMDGETERLEFVIVPDQYADFESGFLGAGTPLARSVTGLAAGQAAAYPVGQGNFVRVIKVEVSATPPPKEVAERREATIRKAVEDSDRTNAMIFASSFSGKWGDYDPTGFVDEENQLEEDQSSD